MNSQFSSYLANELPDLEDVSALISENLLANKQVKISPKTYYQMQDCVSQVYQWSQSFPRKNYGICNSFDFHLTEDGTPKIIEINTNAAFLALGYFLNKSQNIPMPVTDFTLEQWLEDIRTELDLFGKAKANPNIAIIDETPSAQRLYVEFLVYQAFLRKNGLTCVIADPSELIIKDNEVFVGDTKVDFIYNRSTDFFFEGPNSKTLKEIYEQELICISPHPKEYQAIADKKNLLNWSLSHPEFPYLLKAWNITHENAEDIWQRRRKLFFKPFNSYGSKQSYRGESISKGLFQGMIDKDFIAQEYCPAQELEFQNENQSQKLKVDFRVYTYRDKIEHIIARLYQGQLTNLKTPGGGFAAVEIA